MTPDWLDDVARFAATLEATQQELFATLRFKRRALATGNAAEIEELTTAAAQVAQRLKALGSWRERLLVDARKLGYPQRTVSDVLETSAAPQAEQLRARLVGVQARFAESRREAWIQWIIAQRAGSCYTDILDLLARGGTRSPVYGDSPEVVATAGGIVLDAAV